MEIIWKELDGALTFHYSKIIGAFRREEYEFQKNIEQEIDFKTLCEQYFLPQAFLKTSENNDLLKMTIKSIETLSYTNILEFIRSFKDTDILRVMFD